MDYCRLITALTGFVLLTAECLAGPLDTWLATDPLLPGMDLRRIMFANGRFVAVGGMYTFNGTRSETVPLILTSTDGAVWTQRTSEVSTGLVTAVTFGQGRFVAICAATENEASSPTMISTDGVSWRKEHLPGSYAVTDVVFDGTNFVAVALAGAILTSTDGVSWLERRSDFDPNSGLIYKSAAFGNGILVKCGLRLIGLEGGPINVQSLTTSATSSDGGLTWWGQPSATIPGYAFYGVTYGENQFVAIGPQGSADATFGGGFDSVLATSRDGGEWQRTAAAIPPSLFGICYGAGRFVGVGASIISSADAVTWTEHSVALKETLLGAAYGNGRFVAFDTKGRFLRSGVALRVSVAASAGTGTLSLEVEAPGGLTIVVQSSSDLRAWHDVTRLGTNPSGRTVLNVFSPPGRPVFYRVQLP